MDIRSALDNLIIIQAALSITSPITASIKKAYKYIPKSSVALPDTPAWLNEWTLNTVERFVGFRIQTYTVHMQLFVLDADPDRGADIASSFAKEMIDALDADVSLGQTITQQTLRGGNPTQGSFERVNLTYSGLDLFLDLEMKEGATFA